MREKKRREETKKRDEAGFNMTARGDTNQKEALQCTFGGRKAVAVFAQQTTDEINLANPWADTTQYSSISNNNASLPFCFPSPLTATTRRCLLQFIKKKRRSKTIVVLPPPLSLDPLPLSVRVSRQ